LVELPLRTWWPGLFVLLLGLVFHLLGYRIQQPRFSIIGLFLGIYGLTGMAWGPEWMRKTVFPFVLFVFSIPLGTMVLPITFQLRMLVCDIVEAICHAITVDIVRDGTNLRDPGNHYGYEVAAACSGIPRLIATGLLATVYAMLGFKIWWKRALLMASSHSAGRPRERLPHAGDRAFLEWISPSWGHAIHEGGPLGIWSLLPYVPPFFGLIWLGQWLERPQPSERVGWTSAGKGDRNACCRDIGGRISMKKQNLTLFASLWP